jgi:transposase
MARPLVSDQRWERIEPLIPKKKPEPRGGRPRVDDRACLVGILFVLRTGIAWRDADHAPNGARKSVGTLEPPLNTHDHCRSKSTPHTLIRMR